MLYLITTGVGRLPNPFVIPLPNSSLLGIICTILLLPLTGCVSAPMPPPEVVQQISALRSRLINLSDSIDATEAGTLAYAAVTEAQNLAHEYRAVSPAWMHNVMVNYGLRSRGLCFEWANDLFLRFLDLNLKTVDLHLIVAHIDTPREHNAIAVTPRDAPFTTGVVLDAWRHSGILFFGPMSGDKYPWELLDPERFDPAIQKRLSETVLN